MSFREKMISTVIIAFAVGCITPLIYAAFGTPGLFVILGGFVLLVGLLLAITSAQQYLVNILDDGMIPVEIVEDITID